MELEGLQLALEEVEKFGVKFEILVTDRHAGVKKYMKETHPTKKHHFDAFHVVKCKCSQQ